MRSAIRSMVGLLVVMLWAGPALSSPHFTAVTSPENVAGERRTTAIVDLKGAPPDRVGVYVSYATTAAGVEARPGTYGDARCTPYGTGQVHCTMIFPYGGNTAPNPRDANPQVISPGQKVHFRWRKDVQIAGATEALTISDTAREFVMPRKLTIANLGDSYSCGEGAPQQNFDPAPTQAGARSRARMWAAGSWSPAPPHTENPTCHRSRKGGQYLGVVDFINGHRGIEVAFKDVGCSGATIAEGILSTFKGQLPQVSQVSAWLHQNGYDQLDALLLSIGGNDMGFGDIITGCLVGSLFGCHNDPEPRRSSARI